MKLESVWIVSDPTLVSVLEDILFEQPIATLHHQIVGISMGGNRNEWQTRHFTVYTEEAEARADALSRMAAIETSPHTCQTCGVTTYPIEYEGRTVKVTVPA